MGVFAIPILLFLLLQLPIVQNRLTSIVNSKLSVRFNNVFKVGHINYIWLNHISLGDFFIRDQHGDTLLFAKNLSLSIDRLNFNKKVISFSNIIFSKAFVNIRTDSTNTVNFQFLLDSLAGGHQRNKGKKTKVLIQNAEFLKTHFHYSSVYKIPKWEGIDFSDMDMTGLSLRLRNLQINDSLTFDVRKLSFRERSGFFLDHLDCSMNIWKSHLILTDFHGVTPNSDIKASRLGFYFETSKYLAKGAFGKKVKLLFDIQKSELDLNDLAYFSPILFKFRQTITLSGRIYGLYSDLKGRNISIRYNNHTELKGKFNIYGLPDVSRTFLYADISHFETNIPDLESIKLVDKSQWLKLPQNLKELGNVSYKGNFTGFFDDFVAYGKLNSELGILSTDILIRPDTSKYTYFKGKISTDNFELGRFTQNIRELGKISMNLDVNGSMLGGKKLNATLNGRVESLNFHGYDYRNIALDGDIGDNIYDGTVSIDDPNIKFNFNGRLDFAKSTPEFDFSLNIPRICPYRLHFINKDSTLTASALIVANFVGNNIDNINGDIKVLNSLLTHNNKQLKIYNINLTAENKQPHSRLLLKSDFFDASLEGKYVAKEFGNAISGFFSNYVPSLFHKPAKGLNLQDFNFAISFKKTDDIFNFFMPQVKLSEGSHIDIHFNSGEHKLSMLGQFPTISYGNLSWINMYFNSLSDDTSFTFETGSELLTVNKQIRFDNLTGYLKASHDSAQLTLRSLNWDDVVNKGSINAAASFTRKETSSRPVMYLTIKASDIMANNIRWHLGSSHIISDSSSIATDGFSLYNDNQYLKVYGKMSSNPNDQLSIELKNLNVSNLNLFTAEKGFKFNGHLSGKAILTDVYTSPMLLGAFNIDTLSMNGEELGATAIETKWDNENQQLDASLNSKRGDVNTIKAFGHYKPADKSLDFKIDLDKMQMNVLRPYLNKIASNIKGTGSGQVQLTGDILTPLLNGEVDLQNVSFLVGYINTTNSFNSKIKIKDSDLFFDEVEMYDTLGNKAIVNGSMTTSYLKKLYFNFDIDAQNYCFLNTKSQDNDLFYGRAFGSGKIRITGPPENITMTVTARSEKNTLIYIPLSSSNSINDANFINFVTKEKPKHEVVKIVKPKLNVTGLQMNFDLTLTPDAEVQLLFDPKIGDIIKGDGNGNLKLEINTLGKFKMYGDYTVEEGKYLFTLRNVINKQFKVEKGGTIQWNGDPKDALINLKAIYSLKTSLYNLLLNDNTPDLKNRIPIDCQIFMTNKLMRPDLRFDIYLPVADEETRSKVANAISTSDEMTKQFLALLVINNFMPDANNSTTAAPLTATGLGLASAGVTGSELLSDQLSNWFSQLSKDFDLGVNYRPNNQISGDEYEVALSTQLLNDRVTIHANADILGNHPAATTNTNNIVGDVDVGIKLNQSGKLNLKVFNRSNNMMLYDIAPYTQGVGLSYKEEFNHLSELLKHYFEKLSGKPKAKTKTVAPVDK